MRSRVYFTYFIYLSHSITEDDVLKMDRWMKHVRKINIKTDQKTIDINNIFIEQNNVTYKEALRQIHCDLLNMKDNINVFMSEHENCLVMEFCIAEYGMAMYYYYDVSAIIIAQHYFGKSNIFCVSAKYDESHDGPNYGHIDPDKLIVHYNKYDGFNENINKLLCKYFINKKVLKEQNEQIKKLLIY